MDFHKITTANQLLKCGIAFSHTPLIRDGRFKGDRVFDFQFCYNCSKD